MCDQMIYAEIFHFNCEPHISGWAWAYIAASDKKKKKKEVLSYKRFTLKKTP